MLLDVVVEFVIIDGVSMHRTVGMDMGHYMTVLVAIGGQVNVVVGDAVMMKMGAAGRRRRRGHQRTLQRECRRSRQHDGNANSPQEWSYEAQRRAPS